MLINNSYTFPHFHKPLHHELQAHVEQLNEGERNALEGTVYHLAKADGEHIPEWDTQWGKYHMLDRDDRLIAALLERRKAYLKSETHCSDRVADLVVRYCPFEEQIRMGNEELNDLVLRARNLTRLEELKDQLNRKYHEINLCGSDSEDIRTRGWRAQETFILTLPACMGEKQQQRLTYFTSVVEELIHGNYDSRTARMILDRLLERESLRPSSSNLQNHMRLMEIKKIAQRQINERSLNRADESICKDIFLVPSNHDRQGKFKPLSPSDATKEAYAYHCDRMLGIGMTAPTMVLNPENFVMRLAAIRTLFKSATALRSRNDTDQADLQAKRAFALLSASDFPHEVKNSIFSEMYVLCGSNQCINSLGEKLFFNTDGHHTSDVEKSRAIENYMHSEAFTHHQSQFDKQGSVQIWRNYCKRGFEYIVQDPHGGAKLKTAPKTLAHFYALLGIIKGSMDCSSGNTLVEYDDAKGEVSNFWDIDDERSMPPTHQFWNIRLWQMGLPQCAQPFDRAFLLLFSDPALLEKLKKQQSSPHLSGPAYKAQTERLEKIIKLFNEELLEPQITLTPRELFFSLFGGSREDFDRVKKGYNDDKTYGREGIRISPIELFEFHLPEMGRGAWYTGNDDEMRKVGANMRTLYYPELP